MTLGKRLHLLAEQAAGADDGCRPAEPSAARSARFSPSTQYGPDVRAWDPPAALAGTIARGMDARRRTPAPGKNSGSTLANAMRALATRMSILRLEVERRRPR